MNGSNDTKEDHGSHEPPHSQGREGVHDAHSGRGAASALARFKSQNQERQMLVDPEGTSGGRAE